MRAPHRLALPALIALLTLGTGAAAADVVTDWNDTLLGAVRTDKTNPPRMTRIAAMMNAAIYDAVIGIDGTYEPYAITDPAPAGASREAAAAAAAHRILAAAYPAQAATFDAALATSLGAVANGQAKQAGIAWGEKVAGEIITLRTGDHADEIDPYESPDGANWWVPTPPAFAAPLLPNWPAVTPWTMSRGDQFRQPAPPPLTSAEYTRAFLEVKRLGRATGSLRTPDQSEIAQFWNDGMGTETPPGHWLAIAEILATARGNTLEKNARLFALLAITQADAAIVSWDNKYHWNHWRPVTAIVAADTDGNPATAPDPGWSSFITTPPFPTYTSGHSTFSGASSEILIRFFGTDAIPFMAPSDGLPNVRRNFQRISQAAAEAGQSRVYGGIHWQYDNQAGLASGRALADHVFFNFLRPVTPPGACSAGDTTLCLGDGGRFKVTATWTTAAGDTGAARAASLPGDSGRFWFFDAGNTELTVKLLDACSSSNHFWFFASGLTNVEVVLQVTDTTTGRTRTYFNPQGRDLAPILDASAFATCP